MHQEAASDPCVPCRGPVAHSPTDSGAGPDAQPIWQQGSEADSRFCSLSWMRHQKEEPLSQTSLSLPCRNGWCNSLQCHKRNLVAEPGLDSGPLHLYLGLSSWRNCLASQDSFVEQRAGDGGKEDGLV